MRSRSRRSVVRSVGLGVVLAAVALAVGLALGGAADGESDSSRAQPPAGSDFFVSCVAVVFFDDRTYLGNGADFEMVRGESLGSAEQPACRPANDDSGPASRQLEVWRIDGVDERIAIATAQAASVYVAPGRCVGFADPRHFNRCLQRPVELGDVRYVETGMLEPVAIGEPLGSVTRAECCGLAGEEVALAAIRGADAKTAIVDAADPTTVYVAVDECLLWEEEALRRCLTAQ